MKTLLSLVLTLSTASLLCAQTPAPAVPAATDIPATTTGIMQTTIGWLSSLNTNMPTFTGNRAALWMGATSMQGGPEPLLNDIGLSYDIFRAKPSDTGSIFYVAPELLLRNTGVAGKLVSAQGGFGGGVILSDLRIGAYADGGGYVEAVEAGQSRWFGEIGLRVSKGLGAHFATGVGFGAQFPDNRTLLSAFVSANF